MSVQKIIQESIAENPLGLKQALQEELRNRIAVALESKIAEAKEEDSDNNGDDSDDDSDDEEELDEVSGATLGSYYVKADKSRKAEYQKAKDHMQNYFSNKDSDKSPEGIKKAQAEYDKYNNKANKRMQGMNNAMNKLTGSSFAKVHAKEEFDLSDFTIEELESFIMSEEFEQLDELDKKTLASYVKKAAGVAHRNTLPNAMRDRMTAANIGDKEWYKQSGRIADNRSKGIQRAADKLAK